MGTLGRKAAGVSPTGAAEVLVTFTESSEAWEALLPLS